MVGVYTRLGQLHFLSTGEAFCCKDGKYMTPGISTRVNKTIFTKNKIMDNHVTLADIFLTSNNRVISD